MSTRSIHQDQYLQQQSQLLEKQPSLKMYLKVIAKSANFLKVNFSTNQVQITDQYAPSKPYTFDKVFNEYADPLRIDHVVESLSSWQNYIVMAFTNNTQQMNLFAKENTLIKQILASVPVDMQRILTQRAMQPIGGNQLESIKKQSQRNINPISSIGTEGQKNFRASLSFYGVSCDGIMDFGKFAQDKIKTKKDPQDLERVPIFNQIGEDSKTQDVVVKGLTKFESIDSEQLISFYQLASGYFNEYLMKRFSDSDEKFFHQILQLTVWSPQDSSKKRASLFFVDLAVPVQSFQVEQQMPNLNQFLVNSLTSISIYLKEYYKDKSNVSNSQVSQLINYDGNFLTKMLKKVLSNQDSNITPMFFINSKEEFKDESKQLLALTQQIQGVNRNDDIGSKFLTPKDGSQSPSIPKPEDLASAIMMDKLSKENNELRRQFEHMRKVYKGKLDEFRLLLGLDIDLEALIKARPNSKEMNALKFYKEAKERAETLGRINRDLEKKFNGLQDEVDEIRKEKNELENKYLDQFSLMEGKIEKLRTEIQTNEKNFATSIDDEKKQRKMTIDKGIQNHYGELTQKASMLFKLGQNTDTNTNLLGRIYDSSDQGKRNAEHEYKTKLLYKTREHKELLVSMKKEHDEILKQKDERLSEILDLFKEKKQQVQQEVEETRNELKEQYQILLNQQMLIQNFEDGVYTQGLRSHYVPPAHKPILPHKDSHKQLFTAISKSKVKESMQQHYEVPNPRKQQKEKFMETFLMQTQTIQKTGQEQISKWQQRLKSLDLKENAMAATMKSQSNTDNFFQVPTLMQKQKQGQQHLQLQKKQEQQTPSKQLTLSQMKDLQSLDEIDPNKLNYNDLQLLAKELQKEFKTAVESDLNPKELSGEPMKKVVQEIDKFKQLFEQELKISNDINDNGSLNRPATRQLVSSQSVQRIHLASRSGLQTGQRGQRANFFGGSQEYQTQMQNVARASSRGLMPNALSRVQSSKGFMRINNGEDIELIKGRPAIRDLKKSQLFSVKHALAFFVLTLCLSSSVMGGLNRPPGVSVRIVESTVSMIKRELLTMIPYYINWDIAIPKSSKFTYEMWPEDMNLALTNIQTDNITMNIKGFKFDFHQGGIISVKLPIVNKWTLSTDFDYQQWIFAYSGAMILLLQDINLDMDLRIGTDNNGQIVPEIDTINLNFGQTHLSVTGGILQWMAEQFFNIGKVVVENSVNLIGKPLINWALAPLISTQLTNFAYYLPVSIDKFDKTSTFMLDYRFTQNPYVTDNSLDVFVLGELNKCSLPDGKYYDFYPREDLVQIILSDRVINCALIALEQNQFLTLMLNTVNMRKYFDQKLIVDTNLVSYFFPQFRTLYGDNVPVDIVISFMNTEVLFGQRSSNIIISTTLQTGFIVPSLGQDVKLQQEMRVDIAFDLDMKQEVISANINQFFRDDTVQKMPSINQIGINSTEYQSSLDLFDTALKQGMDFANSWMPTAGMQLPHSMMQYDTDITYLDRAVRIIGDVKFQSISQLKLNQTYY